ncbi:phage tail assembly chaperone [Salinarimonas soli]|uniref:phage tail assembly chaperone n=1 Tax=Salinarimonas soli TaxID=1638099 RepID=UPI0027B9FDE2|nr:phage tail assembly chaperone [Salinarimonas soli]
MRLTPDAAWALTPRELAMVLRPHLAPAPLDRATLDGLLRAYPDDPPARDPPWRAP